MNSSVPTSPTGVVGSSRSMRLSLQHMLMPAICASRYAVPELTDTQLYGALGIVWLLICAAAAAVCKGGSVMDPED